MDKKITSYLKNQAKKINREIEKIIPKTSDKKWLNSIAGKIRYDYDLSGINQAINTPIHDLLNRGGKRWRPVLMLLCIEAVGSDPKKFMHFSVLPEMIHNGTLMIDDIEDDSDIRRGKKCIHKKYGTDIAINAGNAMYYLPTSILYKNNHKLSKDTRLAIYDLISEEMTRLHIGQGMDIYWHKNKKVNISESNYLQMCAFKTGTLARLSAKLGVMLGAGTESQKNTLGHFAETIGIAFQIQDDILNLKSKTFAQKKGLGEDIHEGKKTLLVLHALKKLKAADRKRLIYILNLHTSSKKLIKEAIGLIESAKSFQYADKVAKDLVSKAWLDVDKLLPKGSAKSKLKDIANYLIQRKI